GRSGRGVLECGIPACNGHLSCIGRRLTIPLSDGVAHRGTLSTGCVIDPPCRLRSAATGRTPPAKNRLHHRESKTGIGLPTSQLDRRPQNCRPATAVAAIRLTPLWAGLYSHSESSREGSSPVSGQCRLQCDSAPSIPS